MNVMWCTFFVPSFFGETINVFGYCRFYYIAFRVSPTITLRWSSRNVAWWCTCCVFTVLTVVSERSVLYFFSRENHYNLNYSWTFCGLMQSQMEQLLWCFAISLNIVFSDDPQIVLPFPHEAAAGFTLISPANLHRLPLLQELQKIIERFLKNTEEESSRKS